MLEELAACNFKTLGTVMVIPTATLDQIRYACQPMSWVWQEWPSGSCGPLPKDAVKFQCGCCRWGVFFMLDGALDRESCKKCGAVLKATQVMHA